MSRRRRAELRIRRRCRVRTVELAHCFVSDLAATITSSGLGYPALDDFARARRHQVDAWKEMDTPGVREAVDAAVELAKPVAEKALAAAGRGLFNLRGFVARQFDQKETVSNDDPPSVTKAAE